MILGHRSLVSLSRRGCRMPSSPSLILAGGIKSRRAFSGGGDAADKVIDIHDYKTYSEKVEKSERAIAYYTAVWCPPCRAIKPVYSALSIKHPSITFMKVDVDANEEAASKANVRTIPAFHFYRKGKLIDKVVGADQKKLISQIEDLEDRP